MNRKEAAKLWPVMKLVAEDMDIRRALIMGESQALHRSKMLWPIVKAFAEGETLLAGGLPMEDPTFNDSVGSYKIQRKPVEKWGLMNPQSRDVATVCYSSKKEAEGVIKALKKEYYTQPILLREVTD